MKKEGERKVGIEQATVADRDRPYWVGFHHVPFIGAGRMRTLLDRFGSLELAWQAEAQALKGVLDERSLASLVETRQSLNLDTVMARLERSGTRAMTLLDDDYPRLLAQIPSPPPVLFMRGSFSMLDEQAVGIVGTRRMTPYGREVTEDIGGGLARAGVTIVSGLARGVDGVAHRAAIAAEGRTIAVLGGGIDRVYPTEHRRLAQDVADHGVLLSEYMPDEPADAPHFPARNRIISGLSLGVVVTEAPERSGALITVDFAADQGRDVFAVPGHVTAPNSAGCNRIIRDGARIVRTAEDILEDLRLGSAVPDPVQQPLLIDERDRRLIAVLTGDPQHIDDIAALVNLTVSQVSVQLMTLELQGLVRNVGAQNYVRR
jgi:DNA processing protein